MLPNRRPVKRIQHARPFTLPAPTGGLNNRDALANMPANDAFQLDNWFPNNTALRTRKGCIPFTTSGIAAPVESLATWEGGASSKMLAFAGGSVYDVTAGGAVGAEIAGGKSSNLVNTAMFSNAGAQFLIGCSGADPTFQYDGTTFSNTAITGITGSASTLRDVLAFKGRLFFAQTGTLGFYYLPVGNISGAASFFDLSQVAKSGGYVTSMATFSTDTGTGPQDFCVFMTTKGEYLVYDGIDPSNANTWALVGRYYAPSPIGRKGWFSFRGDLMVITTTGILPFSIIRQDGAVNENEKGLSAKLGTAFTDLSVAYGNTQGWQGFVYPRGNMVIVNAPAGTSTGGTYYQLVMNTDTNAWCRFKGWNALCWATLNDRIYFGTYSGAIMLADEGYDDNGADIALDSRQAYNYFSDGRGSEYSDKHFHFAVFVVATAADITLSATINVNFKEDIPTATTVVIAEGATWDISDWDVSDWGGSAGTVHNVTIPLGKLGYTASAWMRFNANTVPVDWYATRFVYEVAQGIGELV